MTGDDPFDRVFGPKRSGGNGAAAPAGLAEVRAWLGQWEEGPGRVLKVIEHAQGRVELLVRAVHEDPARSADFSYEPWLDAESPAGRWLVELGMQGEAQLIAGWDYLAEQQRRSD